MVDRMSADEGCLVPHKLENHHGEVKGQDNDDQQREDPAKQCLVFARSFVSQADWCVEEDVAAPDETREALRLSLPIRLRCLPQVIAEREYQRKDEQHQEEQHEEGAQR